MRSLASLLVALRKVVLLVLTVGLLSGAAWGLWQWRASGPSTARYRTEKVVRGRVAALINASGTVVPEEVVDVGAQVAGRILEFGEDLDDSSKRIDYRARVKKGTILAQIDPALYQAEKDMAEAELRVAEAEVNRCRADLGVMNARLEQASRDLDRARRMGIGSGIAAAEYDNFRQLHETARANVPAARAALEKAEKSVERARAVLDKAAKNLEYTTIRSPVEGVIIDRRVNIGQTVVSSLNAPSLFLIAKDLRKMQAWASVNEADIGRIHVGQQARFKVDAFPDEVFSGAVAQIRLNASMTQNVVTYTVVVSTENKDLKLLPYLTANLQFCADQRDDVLLVSNAALRYRPTPERVHPDHLAEFLEQRKRKPVVTEMKPGKQKADNAAAVWMETEGGHLQPILVRTGLTDGNVTEIAWVTEGELGEGMAVGVHSEKVFMVMSTDLPLELELVAQEA